MTQLNALRRVLLIEGEANFARAYLRALTAAGLEVIHATSGKQALKAIETQPIGVVVTEASVPDIDGIELVRQMGRLSTSTAIILLLQSPDDALALRGLEAGAQQCLVKPGADMLRLTVIQTVRLLQTVLETILPMSISKSFEELAVTATQAKNTFGSVLDKVIEGHRVVITKHSTPKAVVLPYAEYEELSERGARQLNTLSAEFDALLARMQTPAVLAGMKDAFNASPALSRAPDYPASR